jgi:hypothetical protein
LLYFFCFGLCIVTFSWYSAWRLFFFVMDVCSLIFAVYLTTLFSNLGYIASNERVISEWWIGKDLEGSGRLILRYYPVIRLGFCGKPRKPSVRITGLRTEI